MADVFRQRQDSEAKVRLKCLCQAHVLLDTNTMQLFSGLSNQHLCDGINDLLHLL
jgi:hypothetical protein